MWRADLVSEHMAPKSHGAPSSVEEHGFTTKILSFYYESIKKEPPMADSSSLHHELGKTKDIAFRQTTPGKDEIDRKVGNSKI